MSAPLHIVRKSDIVWEERVNVDGWPSRAGMYYDDRGLQLTLRLIDYPVGSIEPRHVHPGTHATTVMRGYTDVDGKRLMPLDVILGPSNEPHGPLHYPEGCQLFSAFQGSYYHSEVAELGSERHYRLVQATSIPWCDEGGGRAAKTLIDHGAGRLLLEALRFDAGATLAMKDRRPFYAAVIVTGAARYEGGELGVWDFVRAAGHEYTGAIEFTESTYMLAVTMR